MIAVVFYVPLVLITILYLTIAITIKSQKTAGEQLVSRRGQRIKREKIVLKISIAIMSAFTMGWLPVSIWWLVYFYSSDETVIWSCGFQYFTEIVRFLMYSYCAVNPSSVLFLLDITATFLEISSVASLWCPGLIKLHCPSISSHCKMLFSRN